MIKVTLRCFILLASVVVVPAATALSVYLVTSPRDITGIEALGPNDFPAFEAYYRLQADTEGPWAEDTGRPLDETAAVRVSYTTEDLPIPATWPTTPCGEFLVRAVRGDGPPSVCYIAGTWTVFLAFKEEYPWWRGFVAGFIRGFRFFLSFGQPNEIPFPAVIQVEVE